MPMAEVEREAERLYAELHDRRRIGYVRGFLSGRLHLRQGDLAGIRNWKPVTHLGVPVDEYDIGFGAGLMAALELYLGKE